MVHKKVKALQNSYNNYQMEIIFLRKYASNKIYSKLEWNIFY